MYMNAHDRCTHTVHIRSLAHIRLHATVDCYTKADIFGSYFLLYNAGKHICCVSFDSRSLRRNGRFYPNEGFS